MKNLIFFIFLFPILAINCIAQDSYQKGTILQARERERTKPERLKMAQEQGTQYSGGEYYPTELITWGKGFSNGLAKIIVKGKAGYINAKGQIIIKPKLRDAGLFSENLAPFESDNGKWGFIDTKGQIVIKPQFDWAISFHESLALVQIGELWGFIDRTGKVVIEPKFKEAANFSEGLARVGIYDKDYVWENTNIPNGKIYWGFIDKQGNWAIEPTIDYVFNDFNGGMSLVKRNVSKADEIISEIYFIDRHGHKLWILDSWYITRFNDDVMIIAVGENEKGRDIFSFIDRTGRRKTDKSFAHISGFSEGLAAATPTFGGKYGYINKKGDFVIEPKFESAFSFSEGLAGAKNEDTGCGYIDKFGNWVIKPQFYWVWEFQEGFAMVAPNGNRDSREKTGYIDRNGNYIWKPTK